MNYPAETVQRKIDKWQAGADAIEVEMAKHRSRQHRFHQLGTLPACGKCGMPRGYRHQGILIHS